MVPPGAAGCRRVRLEECGREMLHESLRLPVLNRCEVPIVLVLGEEIGKAEIDSADLRLALENRELTAPRRTHTPLKVMPPSQKLYLQCG